MEVKTMKVKEKLWKATLQLTTKPTIGCKASYPTISDDSYVRITQIQVGDYDGEFLHRHRATPEDYLWDDVWTNASILPRS